MPAGSIFAGGRPVDGASMVGLIRRGRTEETKRKLIQALADAWTSVTGEASED